MINKLEVVRIDGQLMAYYEELDEWSGRTTSGIRKIKLSDNMYYIWKSGQRIKVNDKVESLQRREAEIENALKWFKETYFRR